MTGVLKLVLLKALRARTGPLPIVPEVVPRPRSSYVIIL